jgi:hypothetical protein
MHRTCETRRRRYCALGGRHDFPHVFVNIFRKAFVVEAETVHLRRVSCMLHSETRTRCEINIFADLGRKKKRGGESPHFRMAVVGAEGPVSFF